MKKKDDDVKFRLIKPKPCSEHPEYIGKLTPRSDCLRCWEIFIAFNPETAAKIIIKNRKKT
jgi:hypothetical protein